MNVKLIQDSHNSPSYVSHGAVGCRLWVVQWTLTMSYKEYPVLVTRLWYLAFFDNSPGDVVTEAKQIVKYGCSPQWCRQFPHWGFILYIVVIRNETISNVLQHLCLKPAWMRLIWFKLFSLPGCKLHKHCMPIGMCYDLITCLSNYLAKRFTWTICQRDTLLHGRRWC